MPQSTWQRCARNTLDRAEMGSKRLEDLVGPDIKLIGMESSEHPVAIWVLLVFFQELEQDQLRLLRGEVY